VSQHPDHALAVALPPVLTAPQQIAAAIEDLVLDGSLRPGDRLPSVEVTARRFGVAMPTAHQALRALTEASVLTVARGRNGGYRVAAEAMDAIGRARAGEVLGRPATDPRLPDVYHQLYEVREVQDVLAARVAALHRTDEDLAALTAVLAVEADELSIDDALEVDLEFHLQLARCTRNPLIVRYTSATVLTLRRYRGDPEAVAPAEALAHLDEVLEAVRRQDATRAAEAMRRHLGRSSDFYDRPDVAAGAAA
jgi:GntR family transcriptional regulator, transcriptional repressor for pyruvate dehydrogenase complex